MAEYRRHFVPGGTYFFTVVTAGRKPILSRRHAIDRFRDAFRHVRKRHPFRIDGVVVLPDHLHAIWTLPAGDSDFSTRWRLIKRHFSVGFEGPHRRNSSRRDKQEKGLWQRRFWEHAIRNQHDFNRHLDYIHYNPVKHGLVSRPSEWPWSSFGRYVNRGVYAIDWGAEEEPRPIRRMNPE